jgi:hypothetical protein
MRKAIVGTVTGMTGLILSCLAVSALQVTVTGMDKNANSVTYHFAVKLDPGETLSAGSDFVTVYNFAGLIAHSEKSPTAWTFSSEDFGRTPTWNGYPAVLPVDVPGLNNLTWTANKMVTGGTTVEGFAATTHTAVLGETEYSAQVTRSANGKSTKQAIIGTIAGPAYFSQ